MKLTKKVCPGCGIEKIREKDYPLSYDLKKGKYQSRCKSCKNKTKIRRRKENIVLWKNLQGGKCTRCGYNKCMAALEFHHRDPKDKDESVSPFASRYNPETASTENRQRVTEELGKCDLVCANCHREIHDALRAVNE